MKLNVEVKENKIGFETENGEMIFNLSTDDLSLEKVEDFVDFIKAQYKNYEDNCVYKLLVVTHDSPDNPREWDNVGKMIGFHREYTAGDNHNYDSPLDLMYDLASDYDSDKADSLRDSYDDDTLSYDEYYKKLKKLADQDNLILPVYLLDHSMVKYSTEDFNDSWDSGQVGVIYAPHSKIREEWGSIDDKSLEKAKKCMIGEVEIYSQWANGDVYGFRLIKEDEFGDEVEEIDSCWGFYGRDLEENGIADNIPEEFKYLLNDAQFVYSY